MGLLHAAPDAMGATTSSSRRCWAVATAAADMTAADVGSVPTP